MQMQWAIASIVADAVRLDNGNGKKIITFGPIAQLVEQRTHNPQVAGSSLAGPTEINC